MIRSSFAARLNSVREKLRTLPRFLRFLLISGLAAITFFVLAALFIVTLRVQSFQETKPQVQAPAPQAEAKDPCAGLYNCGR